MAEQKRDYYEVLGIAKGASEDEIKKAYKKMVAYFTPDYRKQWIAENPAEQWIARNVESAIKEKERLNAIAYLQ